MNPAADPQHDSGCCHDHAPEIIGKDGFGTSLWLALSGGIVLAVGEFLARNHEVFSGSLLKIIACLIMAVPIFRDAWYGLRQGRMGFPCLVAIAFSACMAMGDYGTAGLVAFFMIIATQLEHRTAVGAKNAIEALMKSAPDTANLVNESGSIQNIPLAELKVSDRIVIRPGEAIPADGLIEEGMSSVNESSMTGESVPVDKQVGFKVYAGTLNLTGAMRVRVEKVGEDTTLGQVKQLILSAARSKLPLNSIMEEQAGWYTPLILMLAFLVYYFSEGGSEGLTRAVGVLIVACPCSLILAAPSVMIAAITAAARAGVLVKNAVELEFFHRVEHVFFDKTGTLTTGLMSLKKIDLMQNAVTAEVLSLAGGLASVSTHPSSKGIMAALNKARLQEVHCTDVREIHGCGMMGNYANKRYLLGREEWVASELGLHQQEPILPHQSHLVLGAEGDGLQARFHLEDTLRDGAKECIDELRHKGVRRLSLLTGDSWQAAQGIGESLGLTDIHAKCLPEDKLAHLNRAKNEGRITAIVGDGINDAPVLAAGHVGIAMGVLGSRVAMESANIALMTENLNRLPFLHRLSRASHLMIWTNLGVGMLVIVLGLALVMMGRLSPVLAAVLHNVSALIILFNSARLVKLRPKN